MPTDGPDIAVCPWTDFGRRDDGSQASGKRARYATTTHASITRRELVASLGFSAPGGQKQ